MSLQGWGRKAGVGLKCTDHSMIIDGCVLHLNLTPQGSLATV